MFKLIRCAEMSVGDNLKSMHLMAAALIVVVLIALIIGVYMETSNAQVVAKGDNISVYYTGKLVNGTVFDTNVGKAPLNFTVGAGQMIAGFDAGVIGMKLNQNKTITIPASQAYGNVNPTLIVTVPISQFGNLTPAVGLHVAYNTNGQQMQGVVTEVNKTNATVDFNSPLAGQTLIFTVEVVKIKK